MTKWNAFFLFLIWWLIINSIVLASPIMNLHSDLLTQYLFRSSTPSAEMPAPQVANPKITNNSFNIILMCWVIFQCHIFINFSYIFWLLPIWLWVGAEWTPPPPYAIKRISRRFIADSHNIYLLFKQSMHLFYYIIIRNNIILTNSNHIKNEIKNEYALDHQYSNTGCWMN